MFDDAEALSPLRGEIIFSWRTGGRSWALRPPATFWQPSGLRRPTMLLQAAVLIDMYINMTLFARAEYLTLFKTRFAVRRWAYVLFFTMLYWIMWLLVAFGRALDHVFFPGFKR